MLPSMLPSGAAMWSVAAVAACAVFVLSMLMRRKSQGARLFRPGFVIGIVGRKGSGKSMFLTHSVLRHVGKPVFCRSCTDAARYPVVDGERKLVKNAKKVIHVGRVATNYNLYLPTSLRQYWTKVECWEDCFDLEHGTLLLLDEVNGARWAPSVTGQMLSEVANQFVKESRKYEVETMWSAHYEDRVAKGLRVLTDELGLVSKGMGTSKIRFFQPELARAAKAKPMWIFRYRLNAALAGAYRSFELLSTPVPRSAVPNKSSQRSHRDDSDDVPGFDGDTDFVRRSFSRNDAGGVTTRVPAKWHGVKANNS